MAHSCLASMPWLLLPSRGCHLISSDNYWLGKPCLDYVRSFDSANFSAPSALLEPHERLFEFRQGECVLATFVRSLLEAAQTVNHDGEKILVHHAIDASLIYRAVLEPDEQEPVPVFTGNQVMMMRVPRPDVIVRKNVGVLMACVNELFKLISLALSERCFIRSFCVHAFSFSDCLAKTCFSYLTSFFWVAISYFFQQSNPIADYFFFHSGLGGGLGGPGGGPGGEPGGLGGGPGGGPGRLGGPGDGPGGELGGEPDGPGGELGGEPGGPGGGRC